MDRALPDPPTAVFLHGILGGRKNWGRLLLISLKCSELERIRRNCVRHLISKLLICAFDVVA